MSIHFGVESARRHLADAVRYSDKIDLGQACGIADGLYYAGAIDVVEYSGLRNEICFEFFRAVERRQEGLPA